MNRTSDTAEAERPTATTNALARLLPARVLGAALCIGVALIHISDQHGFPGDKEPTYVGLGYYLLEAGAVAAVILLLGKAYRSGWFLALGVALGPLLGFAWSRGPGMPGYVEDKGNWTETIGVLSLVVEGVLLLLVLAAFLSERRQDPLR